MCARAFATRFPKLVTLAPLHLQISARHCTWSPHAACEQNNLYRIWFVISMAPDAGFLNGTPGEAPAVKALQKKQPASSNVGEVVLGSLAIKPWYPSFYPEELVERNASRLYVCQWCFKYTTELGAFLGHLVSFTCRMHALSSSLMSDHRAENMSSPQH